MFGIILFYLLVKISLEGVEGSSCAINSVPGSNAIMVVWFCLFYKYKTFCGQGLQEKSYLCMV